jgi:hypothetical protein
MCTEEVPVPNTWDIKYTLRQTTDSMELVRSQYNAAVASDFAQTPDIEETLSQIEEHVMDYLEHMGEVPENSVFSIVCSMNGSEIHFEVPDANLSDPDVITSKIVALPMAEHPESDEPDEDDDEWMPEYESDESDEDE